ncbi:MAG: hypothetical protein GXP31_00815 [Kiritimatiellaeota bacterium]|nr:hypothetical protein [Kiritimatiellota bacterium]
MIVLQTETFRWELDSTGRNRSLVELETGAERLAEAGGGAVRLVREGVVVGPVSVQLRGDRLQFRFEDDSRLALRVETHAAHLVLTVVEMAAAPFDRLEFLDVPLTGNPASVGPDSFCFCAVARNLQTRVDELPGPQARLFSACYPKFGTVGSSVAVAGRRFCELRSVLREVVAASPDLPHSPLGGPWALDAPANRGSYLFGVATEETVDEWIGLCRDFGCGQLHFCGGGAFRLGDYTPAPNLFPDGVDSLRRVVDRLHAADIQAGLHTLSFSIAKDSGYVTPVPDARLGIDHCLTLASDLGPDDDAVPVVESTADMPRRTSYHIRTSMTLKIDEELIDYASVRSEAPYALTGCARGAYGTTRSRHRAGVEVRHLKACWAMFAPDADSTLFTEIAANIADLINAAGFDMVYLDGLDGAHIYGGEAGRWYQGGRFAFEVYERLDHPVVMEMAAFLHHLWFLRSRMGAWDCPARGHKTFIDMHCRSNANFARIFLPAHLGWWAPRVSSGPKDETTYLDDVAYLCTKALAENVGFSLQGISPATVQNTPHLARTAPVFRRFEALRRAGTVPEPVRQKLASPGAEFALEGDGDNARFYPVQRQSRTFEPETGTGAWQVTNAFRSQIPEVRIEALWSAADYDSDDGVTIAEFADQSEFDDNGDVLVLLNSGKDFSYPPAAPGMSADLVPLPDGGPDGGPCGEFAALREPTRETVLSSAPDDDFSILDHGERIYRPRIASWVRVGKRFTPELDLGERKALGCWVRGDGSGAVLNFQVRSAGRFFSLADHYVVLDFEGWRYIEMIEPESDRHAQYSWPYGRAVYKLHRHGVEYDAVCALHLWLNNVRTGPPPVRARISPVRALPVVRNVLRRPRLTVNGRSVVIPTELASGTVLEWNAAGCTVFGPKGEVLDRPAASGADLCIGTGENRVEFDCEGAAARPRARVTLALRAGTPLPAR